MSLCPTYLPFESERFKGDSTALKSLLSKVRGLGRNISSMECGVNLELEEALKFLTPHNIKVMYLLVEFDTG